MARKFRLNQAKRKPEAKISRSAVLISLSCFLVSSNSACANAGSGMPPIVVHPVHAASTPVLPHIVNTGATNQGGAAGSQASTSQTSNTASNQHKIPTVQSNIVNQSHQHSHNSSNVSINHVPASQLVSAHTTSVKPTSSLPSGSYQLDLSSTTANIVLGSNLFTHSPTITINVGGTNQTFVAGQKVTAAQYTAIQQQVSGNGQTLVLNAQGAAEGGKLSLNKIVNANVDELVIPKGVTALDFIGRNSALAVSGDLLNYGSIYGVSTTSQSTAGSITAIAITNESGGLISTVVPNSLLPTSYVSSTSTSLSLSARDNITNAGTISSSGGLTLTTAIGAISNTTVNTGTSLNNTSIPAIHAVNDINLNIGDGKLVNTGLVSSNVGRININAADTRDLSINAQGGMFQAANNDINVRSSTYSGNSNIYLSGGDYVSRNLNINGGNGVISGAIGKVTGTLNTEGQSEHFIASSPNLDLGSNQIKGDPTYANTAGSITISGAVTASESLTILAAGDIISNGGSLSTANSAGATNSSLVPSTDITLIAGASVDVTTGGTTTSIVQPPNPPSGSIGSNHDAGVTFTAGVGGSPGGSIIFTGSPTGSVINTSSSLTAGGSNQINGGNVTLVAYANNGVGGSISLPAGGSGTPTINTSSANGDGGNLTIIAGANPGSNQATVNIGGRIVTTGSTSGHGGNVSLYTEQPVGGPQGGPSYNAVGVLIGGSVEPSGVLAPNAQAQTAGVITGGGTGGNIIVSAGSYSNTGTLAASATNSGSIVINAPGGIVTAALDTSSTGGGNGGSVLAFAGNNLNAATIVVGPITTFGQNGGVVQLVNAAATTAMPTLTVNGAINTDSFGVNGFAGPVALVSTGAIITQDISAQTHSPTSASDRGGGIFISSGGTGTSAISTGNLNTTVAGSGSAGNIILLSSQPTISLLNPTNITTGTITQTESSGSAALLIYGLAGASPTIPTQLNVTPTTSINILPGGYQTVQGTSNMPLNFSILNGDSQMVTPISIGATGTSLFLNSLTQATGSDNVSLVLAGNLSAEFSFVTAPSSAVVNIVTAGNVQSASFAAISLSSRSDLIFAAFGSTGISGNGLTLASAESIFVGGNLSTGTSNLTAGSSIWTQDIVVGQLNVTAGAFVQLGSIIASGSVAITTGQSFAAHDMFEQSSLSVNAGTSITTGMIIAAPNFSIPNSFAVQLNGGTSIVTGELIVSDTAGVAGSIFITTKSGSISTGDISSVSQVFNGGTVSLSAPGAISTGVIDTLARGGNLWNSGNVSLVAGGDVTTSDIMANNASFGGNGGAVYVSSGGSIATGNISTNVIPNPPGGGPGNGGNINLSAVSSVTTGVIDTAAAAAKGSGGAVAISAGSFALSSDISTDGLTAGGPINIMANSSIQTGNLDSDAAGAGGGIVLISNGSVSTGNISSFASTGTGLVTAGAVELVSTLATVSVAGMINASASTTGGSAQGGPVAVVAAGAISTSGGISSFASASGVATAGNIFLSGGANSGTVLAAGALDASASAGGFAGSIFLGANVSGTNGPAASGTITEGPITFNLTNSQALAAANPYLFFANAPSVPSTISVIYSNTSSSVNINPGSYVSIGSKASPALLTLDLGGDSRTLVPLVSSGSMFIGGLTANNIVGGSQPFQNNGYTVALISGGASGATGIDIEGNLTSSPAVASATSGSLNLTALNGASITQGAGLLVGQQLVLTTISGASGSGNIGTTAQNVQSNSGTSPLALTVSANGNVFLENHGTVSLGSVVIMGTGSSLSVKSIPDANGNGSIQVAGSVSTLVSGSVNLTSSESGSGTGGLSQTGTSPLLSAGSVNLADDQFVASSDQGLGSGNGSIVVNTQSGVLLNTTPIALTANTGGNVTISDTSSSVVLGPSSGSTINLTALGPIYTSGSTTGSGLLNINTPSLNVVNAADKLQGAAVSITTKQASDLTITNAGTILATTGDITITGSSQQSGFDVAIDNQIGGNITANAGNIFITSLTEPFDHAGGNLFITGGGTMNVSTTGSAVINLLAAANIEFRGNQTFNGNTNITAIGPSQEVIADVTAPNVVGNNQVTINTQHLVLNSPGNITGHPLILNSQNGAGTIANSSGNPLDLSSLSLTYLGQNLTILSAGDITDSGQQLTIDLHNPYGAGGNLTLIAGFNFTPDTGGTTIYPPSQGTFSLTSAGAGNIELANTSITTAGLTYGGNVSAFANGSIDIGGTITATGNLGPNGTVTLIGKGVTVGGLIDTSSPALTQSGISPTVTVTAATPAPSNSLTISGGSIVGGQFLVGAAIGSIALSGITANLQEISVSASASAASITSTAPISGWNLNLAAGGNIGSGVLAPLSTSLGGLSLTATTGSAWISNVGNTLFIQNSTVGALLNLVSTGSISFSGNVVATTAAVTANGTIDGEGIRANSVVLQSINGSIGDSSVNTFGVTATNITANAITAGQNVFLFDGSSATITISNAGSITNGAGAIYQLTSPNGNITTAGSGNGSIGAQQQVLLQAGSPGTITVSSGDTFTAHAISLAAPGGSLSFQSSSLNATVDGSGNGGSVTLSGTQLVNSGSGALTINANGATTGGGGSITVSAGTLNNVTGGLILNANGAGTGNGGTVRITSTNASPTGDIVIGTGAGAVSLSVNGTTNGTVDVTAGGNLTGSTISANTVALQSTSGTIGSSITNPFLINASNVTANAIATGQNIFLSDLSTGNVVLQQVGTLTNAAAATFNFVSTNATGTNISTGAGGTITANSVTVQSLNGGIGVNAANPLILNAFNVIANAASNVNVADNASSTVTIGSSSAGGNSGTFFFTAPNATSLASNGVISAHTISLLVAGTGGSFNLGSPINGTNSGTINLTSDSDINGTNLTGGLNASQINLTSNSGSIGNSGTLSISAATLSGNAVNGSVNLTDTSANTVTIGASSANVSTGTFFFSAPAATTLASNGAISANTVTLVVAGKGGSFNLGSAVSATNNGTINLTSDSNVNGTNLAGGLNASQVNLTSNNGNIGNSSTLTVSAVGISANATNGNVSIDDTAAGTVTVGTSSANATTGTFLLTAPNATTLANSGAIGAHTITLNSTATGGAINLAFALDATDSGTINLTSDSNINNNNVTGGLNAAQVNLTSNSGSIGNGGALLISAAGISATASGGSVSITDSAMNTVTIAASAANASTGMFALTASNASMLTNTSLISADIITLNVTAGSVMLGAQVGNLGTAAVTLNAGGTGSIGYTGTRQLLVGGTLNLAAGGTIGTSVASILSNAQNVNINSAGGLVTITDVSNGETVTGSPGTIGGTLGFLGTGPMNFGNLSAAGTISIVNSNTFGVSNGNIAVNGNLIATGTGSTINLISNGSGNIAGSGSAQANNVNLTTGSGTIGANFGTPLNVTATNVAPATTGLVNVTDSQSITLTGSGINAASSVKLSTANNGNITVNGQIGNNATGAVTLSANGTGNITSIADIHGGPLTLISGTGAIGSNSAALPVVSTNFSASTGGLVNVIDTQTSTAVTVGTSQAGTSFVLSFAGPGPLNLPSITAVNGPVFVAESGNVTIGTMSAGTNATVFTQSFSGAPVGNITVNGPVTAGTAGAGFVNLVVGTNLTPPGPASLLLTSVGSSITATNGSITLENNNTSNGSIVIGNNSTISTLGATGGAVNIVIGTVPTTPIQGTTPAHTSIARPGSGTAYFGVNSISVPIGPANLKLDGANIVFNTGSLPAGAIILGSNISITADPTVSPASINPSAAFAGSAFSTGAVPPSLVLTRTGSFASSFSGDDATGASYKLTPAAPTISSTSGNLSTNAGLFGAVSSSSIQSLFDSGRAASSSFSASNNPSSTTNSTTSSTLPNSGTSISSATAGLLNPAYSSTSWISDTELITGMIPAILASDDELGITPPVSTIVDMHELDDAQFNSTTKLTMPLTGSISRTSGDTRIVTLNNGSVVFAPSRNTIVHTPYGTVKLAAKSLVLIMAFQGGLAVFDLHDLRSRSVTVQSGDHELVLSPGMHAVITHDSIKNFEQINPAQLFGYRGLRERNMGQGMKAFISEFSLSQAIAAVTPLKQIMNSKHPIALKHANHLLKTAAILNQMQTGAYEQIKRTELTAYDSSPTSDHINFGQ
jgi:hypothetical protein